MARAITSIQTSSQSEVCTQSYGHPKSQESQFWEFWDSHLGVPGQNDILVLVPWLGIENYKVWLPPRPNCDESCESMLACGSFMHQRCSNYALTNLLFGLCRFMQGIEFFINLLSPHLGAPTHPSTPNVLRARKRANSFSFRYLYFWTCNWVHQGVWGCVIWPLRCKDMIIWPCHIWDWVKLQLPTNIEIFRTSMWSSWWNIMCYFWTLMS